MRAPSLLASVAIVLLVFSSQTAFAEYDVASYCQLVPPGTKFPSFESCQTYYVCQNYGQVLKTSCSGNEVFNKDTQNCEAASLSNCNYGAANPCENKNGVWAADPKECRLWHYCSNGSILGSGECAWGQYFDNSKQSCENGNCPTSGGTVQITNTCQIMQSGQFFGDFNDCATWYRCNGNDKIKGQCKNGLIYNVDKRMCLADTGNMCAGPTESCTENEKDKIVANTGICSIYYQCTQIDSKWAWKKNQCNIGQYYDVISKNCRNRQIATPIKGCNRCEFTTYTWVNAVDSNCMEYQICQNGKAVSTNNCPVTGGYFNEQAQMCVNDNQGLSNYRKQNGACYVADTTEEPPKETTPAITEPGKETTEKTEAGPITTEKTKPTETTTVKTEAEPTTTEKIKTEETTKKDPEKETTTTKADEETTKKPEGNDAASDLENDNNKPPKKTTTTKKPKSTKKPKN